MCNKVYNKLLALTRESDPITYNIVLQILTDEVEHEEDLVALKEDFDLMIERAGNDNRMTLLPYQIPVSVPLTDSIQNLLQLKLTITKMEEKVYSMPRIGDKAPEFKAVTTRARSISV